MGVGVSSLISTSVFRRTVVERGLALQIRSIEVPVDNQCYLLLVDS